MAMMLPSCMAPSSRMSPQCGCSWCPGGSNTQGREVGGGEGMRHTGEGGEGMQYIGEGGGGRVGYAIHRGGRWGEGRVCNT